MEENILKKARSDFDMSSKELADAIGYKIDSINKAISTNKVSPPMVKAVDVLYRVKELEEELEDYHAFKIVINKAINS